MKTTLNEIRDTHPKPCKPSWDKLLKSLGKTKADDEPLELTYILDTLGMDDTYWVLSVAMDRYDVLNEMAAKCAEHVLNVFEAKHPDDKRPRLAIDAARDPNMPKEYKIKVGVAASDAYYAAIDAAIAAAAVDNDAAYAKERQWELDTFRAMLTD